MCDDWKIEFEHKDLPPEVWDFIRKKKFLSMLIKKEYGGLGFSAITPRFVSQYRVRREPDLLLGFIQTSRRSLAVTSLIFVGGTVLIVLSLAYLVYGGIQQGATYWVTVGAASDGDAERKPPRMQMNSG